MYTNMLRTFCGTAKPSVLFIQGRVSQLIAHLTCNLSVTGSKHIKGSAASYSYLEQEA